MADFNQGPEFTSPPPPPVQGAVGGLTDNVAGAIAYITIIPAIIFLVLAPYNTRPFIRFHSFQSIALGVIAFGLHFLVAIPILGWIIIGVADLVLFIAWIVCIVKALQGEMFKLPIIGNFVQDMANQR